MKLVIDIPEDDYYDALQYAELKVNTEFENLMISAIKDGTPLPKGHGRLIDTNKIEWYGCTTAFDCPHKDRECKDCNRAECSKTQVDNISTIIEADKAESEE